MNDDQALKELDELLRNYFVGGGAPAADMLELAKEALLAWRQQAIVAAKWEILKPLIMMLDENKVPREPESKEAPKYFGHGEVSVTHLVDYDNEFQRRSWLVDQIRLATNQLALEVQYKENKNG